MRAEKFTPAVLASPVRSFPEVSVVVPVFNEAEVIVQTCERLSRVLATCTRNYEIIFVDDGSQDDTLNVLNALAAHDANISLVILSRNFGKELALTAGLDHSNGEAVIIIDADLQDPPECIPAMLDEWRKDFDMVRMRRRRRDGETWFKRFSAWCYYRVLNRISDVSIPSETGDFRLMSRRCVDALGQLNETQRYMKGLFAWIGYPQTEILYDRMPRAAGDAKQGYLKLWRLAIDGITSFSTAPLRLASYVGMVTAIGAFSFGIWILIKTVFYGDPVSGFPTLIIAMMFLGGIQLLAIGVLGEYVGRMFIENKRRPRYFVQTHRPAQAAQPHVEAVRTAFRR